MLRYAYAQLGKPYRYGASGAQTFDCSGLTMKAWAAAGVALSHNAAAQYYSTKHVARERAATGRSRVLRAPDPPRRHLHRRRQVHRGALHRRPATDLQPQQPPRLRGCIAAVVLAVKLLHRRPPYDDGVTRTLVVTNDFPPRAGGIQAFVHELVARLDDVVVYAPAWEGAATFDAAQNFEVGGTRRPSCFRRGASRGELRRF